MFRINKFIKYSSRNAKSKNKYKDDILLVKYIYNFPAL